LRSLIRLLRLLVVTGGRGDGAPRHGRRERQL